MVDASDFPGDSRIEVSRVSGVSPANTHSNFTANSDTVAGQAEIFAFNRAFGRTWEGSAISNTRTNGNISFEVPYYAKRRFAPAKRRLASHTSDTFQDCFTLSVTNEVTPALFSKHFYPVYVATGEDFSLFWYLCPPIFYVETSAPAT